MIATKGLKILFTAFVITIRINTVLAQQSCDCILSKYLTDTLISWSTIDISFDEYTQSKECTLTVEGKELLALTISENKMYDKFPSLFSQTIQKYIDNGERISKRKPELGKYNFSRLEETSMTIALSRKESLIRLHFIRSGKYLYTVESKDPTLLSIHNENLLKVISSIRCE